MASLAQCVYTTSLHLYSLCIDGYLGCFLIFAVVNSAANIEVHVHFWISAFGFSRYIPGVELLDDMVALF